jgi:type VI secretion system secreted protein VgrG
MGQSLFQKVEGFALDQAKSMIIGQAKDLVFREIKEVYRSLKKRFSGDIAARIDLQLSDKDAPSLEVRTFSIRESISGLFEVTLGVVSSDAEIDLERVVGKAAAFGLRGKPDRIWSGLCESMTQVAPEPDGLSTYEMTIVPHVWLLTQRTNYRIFQHMSAPEIAAQILGEWGVDARLVLDLKAYPKLDYRVQAGESDFDFLSRQLEEAGISYFFTLHKQEKKGEAGKEAQPDDEEDEDDDKREVDSAFVMIDSFSGALHRKMPILFVPAAQSGLAYDYVTDVRLQQSVRSGRVTITDFDFRKPEDVGLTATSAIKEQELESHYELYRYEPGKFRAVVDKPSATPVADDRGVVVHDVDFAQLRARVELERERADRRTVALETNVLDLYPGVVFSIDGHPHPLLSKDDVKLFVTRSTLSGTSEGSLRARAEATLTDSPYRPAYTHIKPRILGVQSALVVGPPDEEIHTDEYGRVRVQFHWDREGERNHGSSCWMRVSQSWAGAGFGMMAIPRVGQEVLVGFLEGDPDEPLIVGRVYNQTSPVPNKLPENRTITSLKSNSTQGTGGFNELSFDDQNGAELLYIQAERDLTKLVKHDEIERTGGNRSSVVGKHRVAVVGEQDSVLVGQRHAVVMAEPRDLRILQQGDAELVPGSTAMVVENDVITLTTGRASVLFSGANVAFVAQGDITLESKSGSVRMDAPLVNINPPPPPKGAAGSLGGGAPATGLGSGVDEVVTKSPTLAREMEALKKKGYRVAYGKKGGGSYTDFASKTITLDGNLENNPAGATRALAHEAGHAVTGAPHGFDTLQENVHSHLLGEADAELNKQVVRQELLGNGGPDIDDGSALDRNTESVMSRLQSGRIGYDEAREAVAADYGAMPTSTTHEPYTDYYARTLSGHGE